MTALLFLTTRSIKNGIRRALTTPRRLVSLVIFCAYYYWLFIRPSMSGRNPFMAAQQGQLPAPAIDVLHAVVFAIFVAMSLMLMIGMFTPLTGFRPADVDILFATPVSPKIVLVFRILRDYVATLMVPLLIVVLAFRPASAGWEALFKNMRYPEHSGLALRAMGVAWLMIALVWVCLAYAVTLYTNRSDLQSDRNRRTLSWTIGGLATLIIGYLIYSFTQLQSAREMIDLADSPVLRAFFFTATFASAFAMAPLTGSWSDGILGACGLIGLAAGAFLLAVRQSSWMYDQAAVRGFGSQERRALQQKGDMYGMVAAMAREGKIKAGRRTWIHSLRLVGPRALLWRDYFMQARGMRLMTVLVFTIALFMNVVPILLPSSPRPGRNILEEGPAVMFVFMQVLTNFMVTITFASTGFIETLRRVDLQKPLPFSPGTTVFMEVLSKSMLGVFASWIGALVVLVLRPEMWQFALGAMLATPAVSVVISSATFLLTLMFPDVDDPSQRGLRGLLQFVAIIVLLFPGVALAIGGFVLQVPPVLIAVPVAAVNVGVAVIVSGFAGNLYAVYNPSE